MNYLRSTAVFVFVLSISTATPLYAQHSDVEFEYDAGMIAIEFGSEGRVFEGDFSDFEGGPDATDEPGFGSETDEGLGIDPNDIIGYNVVGPLLYHDGSSFAPTADTLTVENAAGPDVTVTSATFLESGLISQADSIGDFHAHIDFAINNSAAVGAYGLLLSLSAFDSSLSPKGIADSESFYIVFNRGLTEEIFEGAVEDFASVVPEPTSATLILALAAGLPLSRLTRRRRS